MSYPEQDRQYDLVLLGATGYTGQYTAEHITQHLPTNLKWAIAGRSQQKLENARQALNALSKDREAPAIEVVELNKQDIHALAKKTKIIATTVGPYARYGEVTVEACASNGTHYLDVSGESPWISEMVKKYHDLARSTGAIIISQIGVESAPAEIITYAMASTLQQQASLATESAVLTIYEQKALPSGGTLSSALGLTSKYSLSQLKESFSPSAMTTKPVPNSRLPTDLSTTLTGVRNISGLGTLTTSIFGAADVPLVHRSNELLSEIGQGYGPEFRFYAYLSVRNFFIGFLVHVAASIGPLFLAITPLTNMLSRMGYQPGQGPTKEETSSDYVEYRAIALPPAPAQKKAFARLRFQGSAYHLTGIFLSEAAATILYNEDLPAKKLKGGACTPATLGQAFLDRLSSSGVVIETKLLDN